MLRAELEHSEKRMNIRLEGQLAGEDAFEIRSMLIKGSEIGKELIVEITDVSFVDAVGEATLSLLHRLGAKFASEDAYTLNVCERLHLRLARRSK